MVTSPKSPKSNQPSSPPAPVVSGSGPTPLSAEEQTAAGLLPASHWTQQPLAEEDPADDSASTIGSFTSSTASLSSKIFEYRTIHGRTYHGDVGNAEAWEPNDQRHVEAMEIFDFADEFPNAEVIGTDVSPIQPSWVPPNVKFEIDDCNQEWTWAENSFDFIHMRMLIGVVNGDWSALFRNAFRCCKPGGYVESCVADITFMSDDGSVKEGSAMDQWGKVWREAGKKLGRPFTVYEADLQRKGMEAAGFVDIEVVDIYCPWGVWHPEKKAAERGLWYKMAVEADLEGYLTYLFQVVMGWTPEETKVFAAHAKKEWNNPEIHGYFMIRVVYGRKPE
ncbi:hypothetical protein N0V85_004676 [Neurospora sp. IMI 360204]|nr:hypothetical protein N0V85_004676 [Neurospora sp. IMI 360204]